MDYDQQPVHVEMLTLNDITTNQLDSKEARQKFERSAAEQLPQCAIRRQIRKAGPALRPVAKYLFEYASDVLDALTL